MTHKHYANAGVSRNKKPLKNIVYSVEISQLKSDADPAQYTQYLFKELGYLVLLWWYESSNPLKNYHGFITPDDLKELLGDKQWGKLILTVRNTPWIKI